MDKGNASLKGIEGLIYDRDFDKSIYGLDKIPMVIGEMFERWIKQNLIDNLIYQILPTPNLKECKKKGLPKIFEMVDFIATNIISGNIYGIQCKYRHGHYLKLEDENRKFIDYLRSNEKCPLVYYILGFGGYACEPRYVYLANALEVLELIKKGVTAKHLDKFRIKDKNDVSRTLK